jgi:hypothetical protein
MRDHRTNHMVGGSALPNATPAKPAPARTSAVKASSWRP